MSTVHYPAPVRLTDSDTDAVVGLLEKHVEGSLRPEDIQSFFSSRQGAQFPAKPAHPQAKGHSYGHWESDDGIEVFAHQIPSRLNIHAVSGTSFMVAAPGFKGAVWADHDPKTGVVEFTALGMADDAFGALAYKPGPLAKEAIEHQITHHVTGACGHDHIRLRWNPRP